MGIYVNPGDTMFRYSLNSKIYVDKSLMINELNEAIGTDDRFICMSRARRFGKTMMTNLMAAYYSKGRGADKVEIDYIQKKHVKKPGGAKPGFVVYYTNYSMMAGSDIDDIELISQ